MIKLFVNSVQIQRYNALLNEIRTSLKDLEKGIQGLVVMTLELEMIFHCIFDGRVPHSWEKVRRFFPNQRWPLFSSVLPFIL